ncbi:MAG: tRNA uridine-5-carboxymethylaminomethyl(34) synthesis enzyme MnmG, partial [Pseudomonadota bacterium]|nr:tRNA uridine-5-carboxymethylaminomethyl(34) synthesis enzyme MnmG [Pseudomonadota bacterium]
KEEQRLKNTWVRPQTPQAEAVNQLIENPLTREYSLLDLLKRPELDYASLANAVALEDRPSAEVVEQMEILAKYAGYIDRQTDEIEKLRAAETTALPVDFDYEQVKGLSNEVKQKLGTVRPDTLGQAGRIPGVTPAAISLLMIYLKKHHHQNKAAQHA